MFADFYIFFIVDRYRQNLYQSRYFLRRSFSDLTKSSRTTVLEFNPSHTESCFRTYPKNFLNLIRCKSVKKQSELGLIQKEFPIRIIPTLDSFGLMI